MKKIHLTDYIRKSGTQVSLSADERARMKRVLSEYVSMKPMRSAPLARRAPITYMLMSVYAFSRKSVALLLIGGILFSGAGVSFAAENALPGDALYPIKVEVNEPVVSAFSVSSESKVLWNAARAERRLEEAATLATEGLLTEAKKDELKERFERSANRVIAEVERIEDGDSSAALDIASRFENRLLAHEVVLEDIRNSDNVGNLKDKVRDQAFRLSLVRERARGTPVAISVVSEPVAVADTAGVSLMMASEATPVPPPDAISAKMRSAPTEESNLAVEAVSVPSVSTSFTTETVKRIARSASRELADATKAFEKVKERVDEQTSMRILENLAQARQLVSSGEALLAEGEYQSSFEAYRRAAGISAKLTVYLKAFTKSRTRTIPSEIQRVGSDDSQEDNSDNDPDRENEAEDRERD